MAFCQEVCSKLGVAVAPKKLEEAIAKVHRKCDQGLSEEDFSQFFERFLRQLSTQLPAASRSSDVEEKEAQAGESCKAIASAVDGFKALVRGGEWSDFIDITISDAETLQRRL
jgi:hypothetical protein